jgi:hypothetical protein
MGMDIFQLAFLMQAIAKSMNIQFPSTVVIGVNVQHVETFAEDPGFKCLPGHRACSIFFLSPSRQELRDL